MTDSDAPRSLLRRVTARAAQWTALPETPQQATLSARQAASASRPATARSPGRFGVWHLLGLLVIGLVIGSPLLAHSADEAERAARLTRMQIARAHAAGDAAARPSAQLALSRAPTSRSVAVPAVGVWADRVGVPVDPPTFGPVSSPFGLRRHPVWGGIRHHTGIDLAAPYGAPVRATAGGVVAAAGPAGGYGLRVEVLHRASGLTTRYAHLSRVVPGLRTGAPVQRGQIVGFVGATGVVTGPHLHYEVLRPDGYALDPARLAARYREAHAQATADLRRALQSERSDWRARDLTFGQTVEGVAGRSGARIER